MRLGASWKRAALLPATELLSLLELPAGLSREQRFSQDACRNLLSATKLVREALDALERDIHNNFEERDRSVSRMLGNSQPYTTVIEANAPDESKRVVEFKDCVTPLVTLDQLSPLLVLLYMSPRSPTANANEPTH